MRHLARCGRSDRPTGSNPELPVKSGFYEQVTGVKGSFVFFLHSVFVFAVVCCG